MRRAAYIGAAAAVVVVVAVSLALGRLVGAWSSHGTTPTPLTHVSTFGGPAAGQITLDRPGAHAAPAIPAATALAEVTHPFWSPPLTGGPVLLGLARLGSATARGLIAPGPPPVGYTNTPSQIPNLTGHLVWVAVYEQNMHADLPHSCPDMTHPPPGSPQSTASPSLLPVYQHYYFAVLVEATTGTREAWTENVSNVAINDCLKAAQ